MISKRTHMIVAITNNLSFSCNCIWWTSHFDFEVHAARQGDNVEVSGRCEQNENHIVIVWNLIEED